LPSLDDDLFTLMIRPESNILSINKDEKVETKIVPLNDFFIKQKIRKEENPTTVGFMKLMDFIND
jgi:hypothetical protein